MRAQNFHFVLARNFNNSKASTKKPSGTPLFKTLLLKFFGTLLSGTYSLREKIP